MDLNNLVWAHTPMPTTIIRRRTSQPDRDMCLMSTCTVVLQYIHLQQYYVYTPTLQLQSEAPDG